MLSPSLQQLVHALCSLPGIGPKSAQRMAFYLLQQHQHKASNLSQAIAHALKTVRHCSRCHMLCDDELCHICQNTQRDSGILCIVESPADVLAIEQTQTFKGHYFVLMGRLSPLDGIGPQDIGIDLLIKRIEDQPPREVILATNSTTEGEATAHYITHRLHSFNIPCSRIAHGVPMGGELAFIDSNTLAHAVAGRTLVTSD